jgi:hypothetical protein
MPLYRFQVAAAADTTFPADRIVNTLHFNDHGLTSDPQGLCQAILDGYQAAWLAGTREVRVTAYNVGPPPQTPIASAVENEGVAPATASNREVALCLSYFNERGNPRKRGRVFLCPSIGSISSASARPSATIITKALDFATMLTNIGGVDVDWSIYSPTTGEDHPVKGVWVDDAWDVIRSRGLRPNTRSERAFDE